MLQICVRAGNWLADPGSGALARSLQRLRSGRPLTREEGQTTAEYALVLLAAAVAFVLIAWAESTDTLPSFFDEVIEDITNSF